MEYIDTRHKAERGSLEGLSFSFLPIRRRIYKKRRNYIPCSVSRILYNTCTTIPFAVAAAGGAEKCFGAAGGDGGCGDNFERDQSVLQQEAEREASEVYLHPPGLRVSLQGKKGGCCQESTRAFAL